MNLASQVVIDPSSSDWKFAHFFIFDAPRHHQLTFEERMKMLFSLVHHPTAKVVNYIKCANRAQFDKWIKNDTIVMRKPNSYYHSPLSFYTCGVRNTIE